MAAQTGNIRTAIRKDAIMYRLLSHFRTKLLLAFLLCTVIPLTAIGIVSYRTSYRIAQDKTIDSAVLAADQLQIQLNARFSQVERVADSIQYHMYNLSLSSENMADSVNTLTLIRNTISLYKSTFDFYHICIFLPKDRFGSDEGLFFYPLDDMSKFRLTNSELSKLGSSSKWVTRPDVSLPFILSSDFSQTDTVICCRAMHNQGSDLLEYAYFILLDAAELHDMLSASFANTPVSSYVLSSDGYVIAHSMPKKEGIYLPDHVTQPLYDGVGTTFQSAEAYCHVMPLSNGWYHVTEIPKSYISSSVNNLLRSILLTLLCSLPLTLLVILLVSANLTRRLTALSLAMESFRLSPTPSEGSSFSLPRPHHADSYDEIDRLGLTFEQMLDTIRQNLKSVLDLSLSEERLKYQLLQSQINPHFLYNSLGSIQSCLLMGRLDTADLMITDLTRFYRMTLRKSGELIRLQDELEIAKLYLDMEKLCHSNTLDWDIVLEDGIENFMICKFTLQPFLENSILHGICEKTPNIQIQINCRYGNDTVIITISDNGAGIPANQLYELQQSLQSKTVNYEKHFGISNVNARIANELYGNGHVSIDSQLYRGTTVTIEFAQLEGEEE